MCLALLIAAGAYDLTAVATAQDWLHLVEVPLIVAALVAGALTVRSWIPDRRRPVTETGYVFYCLFMQPCIYGEDSP